MKKLILICFLLLPFKVLAKDLFEIYEMPYAICDENNYRSKTNYIRYNYVPAYFFNLNEDYNYHFEDYYEIKDDYYLDLVSNHLWILHLINYQTFYDYHEEYITRYLWEKMYPHKSFHFCDNADYYLAKKEDEYQEVKKRVEKIKEGIDLFLNDHVQKSHEPQVYKHEYLPLYTLVDKGGLNVVFKDKQLTISGEPGDYYLTFKLKANTAQEGKVFTDGVNIIGTYAKVPINEYKMHVIIDPYILQINFNNEYHQERCFQLANTTFFKETCTFDNHILFEVPKNVYHLTLKESILNEGYEKDLEIFGDTTLDLKIEDKQIQDVFVNEAENEEEPIVIIAKNTFVMG